MLVLYFYTNSNNYNPNVFHRFNQSI
jgi:hypothetical protein